MSSLSLHAFAEHRAKTDDRARVFLFSVEGNNICPYQRTAPQQQTSFYCQLYSAAPHQTENADTETKTLQYACLDD